MEPVKRTRGNKEFRKFQEGKHLTRKEVILAMCYDCLGGEELNKDCCGVSCPLYLYYPDQLKNVENRSPRASLEHPGEEKKG